MKVNMFVIFLYVRGVVIISVLGKFFMVFKWGVLLGLLIRNNNVKYGVCRVFVIVFLFVFVCVFFVIIILRMIKFFFVGIESI